jgi:hypothetical protein
MHPPSMGKWHLQLKNEKKINSPLKKKKTPQNSFDKVGFIGFGLFFFRPICFCQIVIS